MEKKIEVFKQPIFVEEKLVPSMVTALAEDFNCPCEHSELLSYLRDDDWGTIIRYPRESFHILSIDSDEAGYKRYVRPIAKRILAERPELAREFCIRVLEDQDDNYWNFFHDKVLMIPELNRAIRKERGDDD